MNYVDVLMSYLLNVNLINNVLLLLFFATFGVFFLIESRDPNSPMHWRDMLLDKTENRLSLLKLGQFVGLVIANWIVIFLVQKLPDDSIQSVFLWVFPMWLAYVGGSWAYNTYLKHIQGTKSGSNDSIPPPAA